MDFEANKSCCPSTAGEGGCWQILNEAEDLTRFEGEYSKETCAAECSAQGYGCCFLNNNNVCYYRETEVLYDNLDSQNRAMICPSPSGGRLFSFALSFSHKTVSPTLVPFYFNPPPPTSR